MASFSVSILSLISFRCFDGSGGFIPVFRWFRPSRLFRFGVSGFSTCHVKASGSPTILPRKLSHFIARSKSLLPAYQRRHKDIMIVIPNKMTFLSLT